jgi:hypothetical protein
MLAHHRSGRRDYGTWIWTLLMLELWHRTFLDGGSDLKLYGRPAGTSAPTMPA